MRNRRNGTTLVEALIFGAVAMVVIMGVIALLTRGGRIMDLGRRTSSAQIALRTFIETLDTDAGELLYLADGITSYDSSDQAKTFAFYVRSTRPERGIASAETDRPRLRRIEYKVEGTGESKDLIRSVKLEGPGTPGTGQRTLVQAGISRLRIRPVIAIRQGPGYKLAMASDPAAELPGSTPMCLVVEVQTGEKVKLSDQAIDEQPLTNVVTKLWCRDRISELSRGALP
jgi:hypothetical protein